MCRFNQFISIIHSDPAIHERATPLPRSFDSDFWDPIKVWGAKLNDITFNSIKIKKDGSLIFFSIKFVHQPVSHKSECHFRVKYSTKCDYWVLDEIRDKFDFNENPNPKVKTIPTPKIQPHDTIWGRVGNPYKPANPLPSYEKLDSYIDPFREKWEQRSVDKWRQSQSDFKWVYTKHK